MKPDWKSLVSQKNREMPEARRKIQKEHTKYQHKLDKLVNKLEKQLFKEVRRQRAGTQEIYDMFEILPRNPAFGMFSPVNGYSWSHDVRTVKDIENILSDVEQRLIVGGVEVTRHDPTSALFLIAVP